MVRDKGFWADRLMRTLKKIVRFRLAPGVINHNSAVGAKGFVLSVYPEGTMSFRAMHTKRELLLDFTSAYRLAAAKEAQSLIENRRSSRSARSISRGRYLKRR